MNIDVANGINASAAQAWQVLGEGFGDWADWSGGIKKSTLNGPLAQGVTRTNDTDALGVVTQELTHFDREARSLTYEFTSGLPPFLRAIRNEWTIEEDGTDRCRIVGHATFEIAWWALPMTPLLKMKMSGSLRGFGAELESHIAQS
jgi:hypothetical protein